MKYLPTIGLEVHTQLGTKTKLFCADKNDATGATPNVNVCPVCMGHPGTLPFLNEEAVTFTIKAGLALECKINRHAKFDRKNYFYPDLPKGYQISQYDIPFCVNGTMRLSSDKTIRIRRIHLEEDAGRLIHEGSESLVDFNRAGVPLIELVTEPDFENSAQVVEFAKKLQILWRYLGISEADMEKGQMRIEANISLNMGTKVEVKNLNSFKAVREGIEYEIKRQKKALEEGEPLIQETRGWEDKKKKTFSQRSKEEAKDYRYFPEPDLPPVEITEEELHIIERSIPELPWERETRFVRDWHIPLAQAQILVDNKETGDYAENVVSELRAWEEDSEKPEVSKQHMPKLIQLAINYIITEIPRIALALNIKRKEVCVRISAENFAELIVLTHQGMVSSSGAQTVFLEMAKTGGDPHHIIEDKGLAQVSDKTQLKGIAKEVLEANKKAVADYQKGKQGALTFLVGQMMAKSKGKANPSSAREVIEKLINGNV